MHKQDNQVRESNCVDICPLKGNFQAAVLWDRHIDLFEEQLL